MAAFTLYSLRMACLTAVLLAWESTMKVRVLLSSIFFMAESVVSGYFRMRNSSHLVVAAVEVALGLAMAARR